MRPRMRPRMGSRMGFWCAAAVAVILAAPARDIAQAQDYPNKPVTFVTPAAAGNSPDVVTRVVADKLTQLWKQQIVVINRPGAGGRIGVDQRRHCRPHPDDVRGPSGARARNAGWRHPAARRRVAEALAESPGPSRD